MSCPCGRSLRTHLEAWPARTHLGAWPGAPPHAACSGVCGILKTRKKKQANVQELIWDTLPVFLSEGGVSVLYLRAGDQETLREAGTGGQEEEKEQEEAHREQREH